MSDLAAPSNITTLKQLADYAIARNGGNRLNKADWEAVKAANPHLKKAPKKRKRASGYGGKSKRGRGGGYSFRGGGGAGTRPIVTYPNISGYGAYELSGYADVDLGDTFRGGLQGN